MTSFVRQATVTLHVSPSAQTPPDGLDSYQLAGYLKLREYHPFSSNPSRALVLQSSKFITSLFADTFHRTPTEFLLPEAPRLTYTFSPPAPSLRWYEFLTFNLSTSTDFSRHTTKEIWWAIHHSCEVHPQSACPRESSMNITAATLSL